MYWYAEWIGDRGMKEEAQTDKGRSHLERYTGVEIGSGKLMLRIEPISRRDFEYNEKRGMKTV